MVNLTAETKLQFKDLILDAISTNYLYLNDLFHKSREVKYALQ